MKKLISIGGCILGVIGLFLTFATVSYLGLSKSVNYIEGDGKIVIVTLIVAALMMFSDKLSKASLIPLAIGLGITIYDGANAQKVVSTSIYSGVTVKLGIGFYLVLVGHVVAGIGALMKEENVVNQPQLYQQPMMNNYPQQPQTGYQPVQPMNNNMGMQPQTGYGQPVQPMNNNMGMQPQTGYGQPVQPMNNNMGMQPQTGYGQPVQPMNNNMGMQPQTGYGQPVQPMNMPTNGVSYGWDNNNNNNQTNNYQ